MGCFPSSSKDDRDLEIKDEQKMQQKKRQPKQMSENDKTTIELKNVRDKLMGKTNLLEKQIETQEQRIVDFVKQKKKERAKFEIEKKKLYEKYLSDIDNRQHVLQKMILEVQQASIDKDCNQVMKQANNFLQDIQKTISLEEMQNIQDDLQQNQQYNDQFNELMENYGINGQEKELEEEYNKLEANVLNEQINNNQVQPQVDQQLVQQQKQQQEIPQQKNNQQQQQNEKQPEKKQEMDELDAMLA